MAYPQIEPAPSPASEEDAGALQVGYRCPECQRVFDTNQGLAAHRYRAHGVAGSSKRRDQERKRQAKASDRPQTSTGIDARKVLKSAFPNGIPATPEAVALAHELLTLIG